MYNQGHHSLAVWYDFSFLIIRFLLIISSYTLRYWYIRACKFYNFEINSLFKQLLLIGLMNTFMWQIFCEKKQQKNKWVIYYIKFHVTNILLKKTCDKFFVKNICHIHVTNILWKKKQKKNKWVIYYIKFWEFKETYKVK